MNRQHLHPALRKRRSRTSWTLGTLAAVAAWSFTAPSAAAPTLRLQVEQTGNFVLVGNTLGHDCANSVAPLIGSVGPCGGQTGDSAPDVFWRSEASSANANVSIQLTDARSTAELQLAPTATITHAFLYWSARRAGTTADATATLERPGGVSFPIVADDSFTVNAGGGEVYYQSVADVTAEVVSVGEGSFRVSGVDSIDLVNLNNNVSFAAWSLLVFYEDPTEPTRNLAVFDGLDLVTNGAPQTANISGFTVPNAGFDASLGVIAYEGDDNGVGDSLRFGQGALTSADDLSDLANPANNFFNSSRTRLGVANGQPGDLPLLSGAPSSMSSFDLDVVDITSRLSPGQTSADIEATSAGDIYLLGALVTSISTLVPDMTQSTKSVVDINGGAVLVGDELQYDIEVRNDGTDTAIDVVVTDTLPVGLSYVPGTLEVLSGPGAGPKTDTAGDDQAEAIGNAIAFRVGAGANGANGGALAPGESSIVSFRAMLTPAAAGTSVANQALVSAAGQLGSPTTTVPTDGNGNGPGGPPTTIDVDACVTDMDCPAATPLCDTTPDPNQCVACLADAMCPPLEPVCQAGTCVCISTGPEICANGIDDDCDGTLDNGCPDSDGDTLLDAEELLINTDPFDADTDDDGLLDGLEPGFDVDVDLDGLIGALDPDSDQDGLFDGTEAGADCSHPDTAPMSPTCTADADPSTTTSPIDADTDNGGVADGIEDTNHNGRVDAGETDPNDPTDDFLTLCSVDADCGSLTSGLVCDQNGLCINGCRGEGGNSCPQGQICTSTDATIGACIDDVAAGGSGIGGSPSGGAPAGGSPADSEIAFEGGGLSCSLTSSPARRSLLPALLLGLLLLRRRTRRASQR